MNFAIGGINPKYLDDSWKNLPPSRQAVVLEEIVDSALIDTNELLQTKATTSK